MKKFQNLKLAHIVIISIGFFLLIGALAIILLVNRSMHQESLREAESKARILLDRNLATHMYFSNSLKPKLFEWTAPFRSNDYFEPAWMSSTFANREIQKHFQTINRFGYYIKDAAVDARNPENEANSYEKDFLAKLKADKNLESQSDIQMIDGKPYLVILRRGEVIEKVCLQCHSEPGAAPSGLLRQYGTEKAFHRQIGDLASVISMRIPLADAYSGALNISIRLSLILIGGLVMLLCTQLFLYRRFLIAPIGVIRDKALELARSEEHIGDTIPRPGISELNDLCDAFNEMSQKLRIGRDKLEERIHERTLELHSTNEALKREIAERKLAEGALEDEHRQLQQAFDEVRTLRGIVPICANCKKIRDDKGYWNQVEKYVSDHTEAQFSHGICPDCAQELYPELHEEGTLR